MSALRHHARGAQRPVDGSLWSRDGRDPVAKLRHSARWEPEVRRARWLRRARVFVRFAVLFGLFTALTMLGRCVVAELLP